MNENIIEEFVHSANNEQDDVTNENSASNNLSILQGLCVIVEKSGCSDLLSKLYEKVFEIWAISIVARIEQQKNNSGSAKDDSLLTQKINKWRIGLISISLKDSAENVENFNKKTVLGDKIIKVCLLYFEYLMYSPVVLPKMHSEG